MIRKLAPFFAIPLVIAFFAILVAPMAVMGQETLPGPGDVPVDAAGILEMIRSLANWLFAIILVVVIFLVLFAAFKFITSGGDPTAVASARNMLLFAAIGIVVALFALVFTDIVASLVNVEIN